MRARWGLDPTLADEVASSILESRARESERVALVLAFGDYRAFLAANGADIPHCIDFVWHVKATSPAASRPGAESDNYPAPHWLAASVFATSARGRSTLHGLSGGLPPRPGERTMMSRLYGTFQTTLSF